MPSPSVALKILCVTRDAGITRRTVLRAGAAAGMSLAAARALPAWAKPVAAELTRVRRPGSRPFPHRREGERYFGSCLGQTYPNRRYLISGSSDGITATDNRTFSVPAKNGTIFDRLDQHHISWRSYNEGLAATLVVPGVFTNARKANFPKL